MINAAIGAYPVVVVDLDGQPRTIAKDKGADELNNAAAKARMLTAADAEPNAK